MAALGDRLGAPWEEDLGRPWEEDLGRPWAEPDGLPWGERREPFEERHGRPAERSVARPCLREPPWVGVHQMSARQVVEVPQVRRVARQEVLHTARQGLERRRGAPSPPRAIPESAPRCRMKTRYRLRPAQVPVVARRPPSAAVRLGSLTTSWKAQVDSARLPQARVLHHRATRRTCCRRCRCPGASSCNWDRAAFE